MLLAFVRLATKEGLFPKPLSIVEAMDRVDAWLAAGPAVVVDPGAEHGRKVRALLLEVGAGGNLVSDAHLATLAIEHKGVVVSYDNDFSRFERLRWESPR